MRIIRAAQQVQNPNSHRKKASQGTKQQHVPEPQHDQIAKMCLQKLSQKQIDQLTENSIIYYILPLQNYQRRWKNADRTSSPQKIDSHLRENNIQGHDQFGFRAGHSIIHQTTRQTLSNSNSTQGFTLGASSLTFRKPSTRCGITC